MTSKNTTHTITSHMYPSEWGNNAPKTLLYASLLRTTGYKFGGNITVTDNDENNLGSFEFSLASGFDGKYLGGLEIPKKTKFPITISSEITCSTEFKHAKAPTVAMGLKEQHGEPIPISYEAVVFCNDAGSDNDWNDCVLTYQLFNSSTD